MAKRISAVRANDFRNFEVAARQQGVSPFTPQVLDHIYIKLDFKDQYERARTAEDATGFLRSVARAAMAAHALADPHGGVLLEAQGSTLHVALPRTTHQPRSSHDDPVAKFVGELHAAYRQIFGDAHARVDGWRMTIDSGMTLVVAGRGAHNDDSWVSLGMSANRPAKHLYAQLELPEAKRDLKRFHVGVRTTSGQWRHSHLDEAHRESATVRAIAEEVRRSDPRVDFSNVYAQAAPIPSGGSPGSPSPERPLRSFGWVLRADLDGFTDRVEEGFADSDALTALATDFYRIMDAAAAFVERHDETLIQLPWAGDNFTVAAVFGNKEAYDGARAKRLVELSLDFEKDMEEEAVAAEFGGWAHSAAGGEVHGNAKGNLYLGGITAGGRRFLIGAGEGLGRSTQGFGDINPDAGQLVVYTADWERFDKRYKSAFEPAVTRRGENSTLYRSAVLKALKGERAKAATAAGATIVTLPQGESRSIPTRPYGL